MTEKVGIVKCPDYSLDNLKHALLHSFGYFGGVDQLVRPGETILLKPNLIAASKAHGATTDARFVEALIEIILAQGAVPVVGDSPAFGSAKGVAKATGLWEVVRRHGVKLIEFSGNAHFEDRAAITRSIKGFDKIINIPKLKAHSQLRFTGATKNLFGLTRGKIKAWRHVQVKNNLERFCRMILRIHELVRPAFTLVDAVEIMADTGPRGGVMRNYGFVFSGTNCVGIDRVMAACLGIGVFYAPLLRQAQQAGCAGAFLKDIEILGERMDQAAMADFSCPETLSDISFTVQGAIKSVLSHIWLKWIRERF